MYKIYDPEQVLEAVGYANPRYATDYEYLKGFNAGINHFERILNQYSREVKLKDDKESKALREEKNNE
nr:MAG TPA: hypothetical protein [Caudoviricetes sp.]